MFHASRLRMMWTGSSGSTAMGASRVIRVRSVGTSRQVRFSGSRSSTREVLVLELPLAHQHEALLLAMVVDGALLPRRPAQRQHLEERRLVDQVARVVARGEERVALERVAVEDAPLHELVGRSTEAVLGQLLELRDQVVDPDEWSAASGRGSRAWPPPGLQSISEAASSHPAPPPPTTHRVARRPLRVAAPRNDRAVARRSRIV